MSAPDTKHLYKRGDIWWLRRKYSGNTIRMSLETSDLRTAQRRRDQQMEKIAAGKWGEDKPRTYDEAVRRWRAEHYPTLREGSRVRYDCSIAHFDRLFQGVRLESISSSLLSQFEQMRRGDGVQAPTIRRDLACLSSLISSAEEWEWVKTNPVRAYMRGRARKGLAEGRPHTRWLSMDEEQAILNNASMKTAQAIAFAIDTGLRREEQFSLLRSDIAWNDRTGAPVINIRSEVSKTHRERQVPIMDRSWQLIQRIMAEPTDSPYLFTTRDGDRYSQTSPAMWLALQNACDKAGVPRASWHDLRRTCGCRLLNEYGYTMEQVSKWLGHSSITVTEKHYAFLSADSLSENLNVRQRSAVAGQTNTSGTHNVSHAHHEPLQIPVNKGIA